jgi:hypothetical protein
MKASITRWGGGAFCSIVLWFFGGGDKHPDHWPQCLCLLPHCLLRSTHNTVWHSPLRLAAPRPPLVYLPVCLHTGAAAVPQCSWPQRDVAQHREDWPVPVP